MNDKKKKKLAKLLWKEFSLYAPWEGSVKEVYYNIAVRLLKDSEII